MYKTKLKRLWPIIAAVSFVVIVISGGPAKAAELADRYIEISTAQPSANSTHTYQFTYATAGQVIHVRITPSASTNGHRSYTDNGAVAFAILSPLSVGANVPPFFQIC